MSVEFDNMVGTFETCANGFNMKFGYRPVLPSNRDIIDKVYELVSCINKCIYSEDDTDYIELAFTDYKEIFGTEVVIEEPSGSRNEIFDLVEKAYKYNIDFIDLYLKGVSLETIDMMVSDIDFENL